MITCSICHVNPRHALYTTCNDCRNAAKRARYALGIMVERQCLCGTTVRCNAALSNKHPKCPACLSVYNKKRYAENMGGMRDKALASAKDWQTKERMRVRQLRRLYGVTAQEFDRMIAEQGDCCAICQVRFDRRERGRRTSKMNGPNVDHDHETGAVRGVLCHACNLGLGWLRDDPAILRSALAYLTRMRDVSSRKD
jgi:hypothetical protein